MPLITSDNGNHSIYRIVVQNLGHDGRTTMDTWNVKASSPSTAASWVLSYKARGLSSIVLKAYKLRRQPVWTRKTGTDSARFHLRRRTVYAAPTVREQETGAKLRMVSDKLFPLD